MKRIKFEIKFNIRIGAVLAAAAMAIGLGFSAPTAAANEIRIATQAIPHYAPIADARDIRSSEAYLRKVGLTRAAVDIDRLLERAIGQQAGLK